MNDLIISGASGLPQRWDDCYKHYGAVELPETAWQRVKMKTARRWRTNAPEGFEFIIAADRRITHDHEQLGDQLTESQLARPEQLGSFQDTAAVWQVWQETLALAEALSCTRILLTPPARFAPSPANTEQLRRFVEKARAKNPELTLIWQPGGMWDIETVVELCAEWSVVPSLDPFLLDEPLDLSPFPLVYYRLCGRGSSLKKFSGSHFEMLLSEHLYPKPSYFVFANANRWQDAKRFSKFIKRFDFDEDLDFPE